MTIRIDDGEFAGVSWSAEEFNEMLRLCWKPIDSISEDRLKCQLTPDDPSPVF